MKLRSVIGHAAVCSQVVVAIPLLAKVLDLTAIATPEKRSPGRTIPYLDFDKPTNSITSAGAAESGISWIACEIEDPDCVCYQEGNHNMAFCGGADTTGGKDVVWQSDDPSPSRKGRVILQGPVNYTQVNHTLIPQFDNITSGDDANTTMSVNPTPMQLPQNIANAFWAGFFDPGFYGMEQTNAEIWIDGTWVEGAPLNTSGAVADTDPTAPSSQGSLNDTDVLEKRVVSTRPSEIVEQAQDPLRRALALIGITTIQFSVIQPMRNSLGREPGRYITGITGKLKNKLRVQIGKKGGRPDWINFSAGSLLSLRWDFASDTSKTDGRGAHVNLELLDKAQKEQQKWAIYIKDAAAWPTWQATEQLYNEMCSTLNTVSGYRGLDIDAPPGPKNDATLYTRGVEGAANAIIQLWKDFYSGKNYEPHGGEL